MIRGISFKLPSLSYHNTFRIKILYHILKCIDIEKYNWYAIDSQSDVWEYKYNTYMSDLFFKKDYYNGEFFLNQINLEYFVVFLKLQAYHKHDELKEIDSYDDFLKSDCQILLFIWDCYFVDIYLKDEAIAKAFYENALANGYTEVEYITDENDERTGFKNL